MCLCLCVCVWGGGGLDEQVRAETAEVRHVECETHSADQRTTPPAGDVTPARPLHLRAHVRRHHAADVLPDLGHNCFPVGRPKVRRPVMHERMTLHSV
jgi:hypothetical protein